MEGWKQAVRVTPVTGFGVGEVTYLRTWFFDVGHPGRAQSFGVLRTPTLM